MKPILLIYILCSMQSTLFADSNDWAVEVIKYIPGNNFVESYTNTLSVLGEASTLTTDGEGPLTPVTVLIQPWQNNQIISLGGGGSLIVRMGREIMNLDAPVHPYGADLIVYGNTFFANVFDEGLLQTNPWYASSEEPAEIWVSNDLTNWFMSTNSFADSLMPTQSIDINGLPSDYLFPVNPALLTNDWYNGTWSYSNTVHQYYGSAGGAPVDLSILQTQDGHATNISFIRYVKIEAKDESYSSEIDAFASVREVPEPYLIYHLSFIICYLLTFKKIYH